MLMDWIFELIHNIGNALMKLLPRSPFSQFIANFTPPDYLGWLNWFFPVGQVLSILVIWLASISLFYLYSIIMRWVKMIGD